MIFFAQIEDQLARQGLPLEAELEEPGVPCSFDSGTTSGEPEGEAVGVRATRCRTA